MPFVFSHSLFILDEVFSRPLRKRWSRKHALPLTWPTKCRPAYSATSLQQRDFCHYFLKYNRRCILVIQLAAKHICAQDLV